MNVTVEFSRPRPGRRARLLLVPSLVLALAVPATALASHIFSDVPTSMSGHEAIEAVYDARVTVGCAPTKYCPTSAVTREQMAIFLQRALPRIAGSQDLTAGRLTDTEATQNAVVLRMGGGTGGTQFAKADVTFTASVVDPTGCPCTIYVYITTSTGASSEGTILTVDGGGYVSGNATLTFVAPSGTNVTINATALIDGPGKVDMYADISAVSGAFGSQGTDLAAAAERTGRRGR
jgi:hypothetical protein